MRRQNVNTLPISYTATFIFLVFFVAGHTLASVLPFEFQKPFINLVFGVYLIILFFMFLHKNSSLPSKPLLLSLIFILFGAINIFIHSGNQLFVLVGPLGTIVGMFILTKYRLALGWMDVLFLILYIFFYQVYFSVIPDLISRPGFDEDGIVFDISSSNAISASLNLTLYAYMILSKYYNYDNKGKLLLISVINLTLILIQHSRASILVGLIILAICAFEYSKKFFSVFMAIVIGLIVTYWEVIVFFTKILGDINGVAAYKGDIRSQAQEEFFYKMDSFTFLFGHTIRIYSRDNLAYTYNVFLDMWDRYTLFPALIFTFILLIRLIKWRKFKYPFYYLLPFLAYSMVESMFFPNYWDVIIYLVIFTPKTD